MKLLNASIREAGPRCPGAPDANPGNFTPGSDETPAQRGSLSELWGSDALKARSIATYKIAGTVYMQCVLMNMHDIFTYKFSWHKDYACMQMSRHNGML